MEKKIGFKSNLGWIFIGNIIHAVLQFILNIYIARVFTTDTYGLVNYSASIVAFFTSIGTLGFDGIITKKFAEDESKAGDYLGTAVAGRLIFSIFAIVALQVFVRFFNSSDKELPLIVFFQSLSLIFGSFDLLIYWFRFRGRANICAITKLIAFFISAVWRIFAVAGLKSVECYVAGVSLETAIYCLILFYLYRREYPRFRLSKTCFFQMISCSYPFIFSALLSTIYGQTDKIMLKSMIDNNAVAVYSVSLTLAGAIVIIPTSLIEGFRPEIMTYKMNDQYMYHRRLKQLYAVVFWICMIYCIFMTVFSRWVILLIYGSKYVEAIPSLSLVVWYTSFSYFGAINNIYMVAENKTKWVQITTLTGAILNIILNALLIPKLGIVGAAGASLITQIIANFVLLYLVPPLREDFYLILEAITLRGVLPKYPKK